MLSPRLLETLRHWWRTERPQHWLFPGVRADKPLTRQAVEKACHEAYSHCGIAKPITPHSFYTRLLFICWKTEPTCAPFNC